MKFRLLFLFLVILTACENQSANTFIEEVQPKKKALPTADYSISSEQTHDKFSSDIPYQLKVEDGSVIEALTLEATGGQLNINSTLGDWQTVDFDKIHTITGPIYVEGAEVGDVIAVEILDLVPGDWGWTAAGNDFGFLRGEGTPEGFRTFPLDVENNEVRFTENITIPLKPFLGVIGVAPPTDERLVTIPPRANGGNMDDPNMGIGTTVYMPVFVEGALLSIGDSHAVQGMGEVVGTAVECDMKALIRVKVIKGKEITEPQYETDTYYATTGFAETVDEAARKATRYMIKYLQNERGLSELEAYMLCSLAGDLKIAEVVDYPNMLVTMHLPKDIFE